MHWGGRRIVQILCDAVKKAAKSNSELFDNLNLKEVNNEYVKYFRRG